MSAYLPAIFPSMLLLAALEALWLLREPKLRYPWQESLASLAVALMSVVCGLFALQIGLAFFHWLYTHRLYTPDFSDWRIALGFFIGMEACYYAYHRGSHTIRWFWASHAVHHTSQHLNLSAAYRLAWTSELSGTFLFYAPMVYLGFPPLAVFGMLGLILLYQFWLHTEVIGSLGPLDWLFNTPANHRVHHALEADCLQRNFGGILMLFDHLFGSYAAERGRGQHRYGLPQQLSTLNPVKIALHEWQAMLRELGQAKQWRTAWQVLFGMPGRK